MKSLNILDETYIHFRIELKGAETLRVRQIKLLGLPVGVEDIICQKLYSKQTNTYQIQQRNCESETLRVFRLLTAQVFGKLILGNDHDQELDQTINNEDLTSTNIRSAGTVGTGGILESNATSMLADSLDLREHMVGILFSRSKLSHLQKQVIVHIVYAIRKETLRAKDEWEALNTSAAYNARSVVVDIPLVNSEHKSESASENSRAPDVYCFEMLSMVLALSGSAVGRSYLSNQHGLLKDLLTLLHTGSDRVQRQVTALLRRILPEVSPEQVADLLGVNSMPPTDFSIVNQNSEEFDMNRLGILDIFLAIISKSLQLQVKIKSTLPANASLNKQPTSQQLCNCIDFKVANLKAQKKESTRVQKRPIEGANSSAKECPNVFEFQNEGVAESSTKVVNEDTAVGFEFIQKKSEGKNLNQRWFLKGTINIKQAENIIALIRDMANVGLIQFYKLSTQFCI